MRAGMALFLIAVLGVGVCGIAAYVVLVYWVSVEMVAAHQRAIAREIEGWEREYSQVSTANQAARGADMIEYIQRYYQVGEGYRSNPETEERLEAQRRRAIESISKAIEEFKRKEAANLSGGESGSRD
jgi:hypothetical protein